MQGTMEELVAAHNPALLDVNGMVAQIWEDGEFTLQKSGPLLHQRSLHCIREGHFKFLKEPMLLPLSMYGHSCVVVPYDFANEWITAVWGF